MRIVIIMTTMAIPIIMMQRMKMKMMLWMIIDDYLLLKMMTIMTRK